MRLCKEKNLVERLIILYGPSVSFTLGVYKRNTTTLLRPTVHNECESWGMIETENNIPLETYTVQKVSAVKDRRGKEKTRKKGGWNA